MNRWTPRVTVAVIVERAGRYLMVEEDRGGPFSLFNQPAGHLERGERLIAAAEREVAAATEDIAKGKMTTKEEAEALAKEQEDVSDVIEKVAEGLEERVPQPHHPL